MANEPFVIYKASAGSGKTHALVREYLTLAFLRGEERVGDSFRSILAITFTNKAAAEMKERIMKELAQMASRQSAPGDGTMGGDILEALASRGHRIGGEELQRMAARLHKAILHRYSDLSVCTIDSFMHRIVRTFAHDLGQPMNFDVMIDQNKIVEQAVAQLMSMAGTDGQEELTEVLRVFAEHRMDDGKGYNVEGLLVALAKQLFKEDVYVQLHKLKDLSPRSFEAIEKQYTASIRSFRAEVQRVGGELLALLEGAGLDATTAPYGLKGYYGYIKNVAGGTVAELSTRTVAAFEEGKMLTAKSPASLAMAVESAMPQMTAKYEELKSLLTDGLVRYNTYRVLLRNLYSLALLRLLDEQVRLYAHDNDMVHISDFNRLINAVVEDEDNPAPFIYERLGNRYRHFLIDEFQDTSRMQWHNMVPLLENGVSQGQESLVVGDTKQFIYRFRQGDVTQFINLPRVDGMKHHGKTLALPGNYCKISLDHNRRSARAIVDFNNSLFAWLAREVYSDNPLVQSAYIGLDDNGELLPPGREELLQKEYEQMQGHVDVNFIAKADAEEAGFGDVKTAIYDAILQTIRLLTEEHGYAYKDIAVLARTGAELAAVSSYMSQHSSVPQTSTESFYLSESHAVAAVIAALRLLHDSGDRAAAADLRYRLAALGLRDGTHDDAFIATRKGIPEGTLPDAQYLASLDLYDCCEEIVRRLGLDGIDTLYVASLLDRVASFAARHHQGVGDFLEWYDEQKNLSASSPEDVDAVQLMTIHKSKGLGKPVVICPLFNGIEFAPQLWVDVPTELAAADGSVPALPAAYVQLSSKEKTLFEPQRCEEQMLSEVDDLNVLYVAFTRPKEQLFVFCPDPTDAKSRREHDRRYPTMLHRFVEEVGYDGGAAEFDHPAVVKKASRRQTAAIERLTFADWTSMVAIASPAEKAIEPLVESKRRFGTLAHDLLAGVHHAGEVEEAIARFAATQQVDKADMELLAELARRVVADEATHRFFDPRYEAKNECDLVDGGRHGRPDRVVFTPDETWVVDFKTGGHEKAYETQVSDYCRAMRAMGYPAVSGWLLYLQPEVALRRVE
jgi:ATP-dependent exoDNAse (exonuclease V) beta subunit